MKRRGFLALLGLAPVAPLVAKELLKPADPERHPAAELPYSFARYDGDSHSYIVTKYPGNELYRLDLGTYSWSKIGDGQ